MHVTLLLGTARDGAQSINVANELAVRLKAHRVSFDYIKTGELLLNAHTIPSWSEQQNASQERWRAQVKKTDVFVMVLPEYNHSFPGEWKLLVDMLAVKEYSGKQVSMVTVSSGNFAGVRVMEQVLPVLVYLEFKIASERLHIGKVKEVFEHGMLKDEHVSERIDSFVNNLVSSF